MPYPMNNSGAFPNFSGYGQPGATYNFWGNGVSPNASIPQGSVPTAGSGFDPLSFALQTGGAILSNNAQQAGANGAIGMAGFNPTGIYGPGGMGVTGNGNSGYNLSGPTSGPFAQFGNLSSNAINYGANNVGTNGFDTAANSALSGFQNFSLPAATNQAYGQLSALTAPTQTAQTQQMLNYEQASGRGGIGQNGVLGDMGGLALAQSMQDTNNALQANQLAQSEGNYEANLAAGFSNQANANRTNAAGVGATGLEGELGINTQLQQLLQSSIGASTARANAGANQGMFRVGSGNNTSNAYGNYFGALGQTLNNNGGATNALKGAYNYLTGGGSGAGAGGGSGAIASQFSGLSDAAGTPYYLAANPGGVAAAGSDAGTLASGAPDWLSGFSGASGQAAATGATAANAGGDAALGAQVASDAQATSNAALAGYSASAGGNSAAGGAALGAGAGAAAAVGLFAAPVIAGYESSPVTVNESYMNNLSKGLASSNPTTSTQAAQQTALMMLQSGGSVGGGKGGQFAQLAAQYPAVQQWFSAFKQMAATPGKAGGNTGTRSQL